MYKAKSQELELARRKKISDTMKSKGLCPPKNHKVWNKGMKGFDTGFKKGHPNYNKIGKESPNWKGGKFLDGRGYVLIYTDKGYIPEHRLVIEKHLGRKLTSDETVHHIDFNKQNNKIDNLMLFPTKLSHTRFHQKLRQHGLTNPMIRQIENRWEGVNGSI